MDISTSRIFASQPQKKNSPQLEELAAGGEKGYVTKKKTKKDDVKMSEELLFYLTSQDEMNSSNWKICSLETRGSGTVTYVCYLNEICCEQGCCPRNNYQHIESWYYWVFLLLLCSTIYFCSWCCKKIEDSRKRRLRQLTTLIHASSLQASPRRNDSIFLTENSCSYINIDNAEATKKVDLPPKYLEALAMPTVPISQIFYNENKNEVLENPPTPSTSSVPPSYEDVVRKTNVTK